MRVEFSKTQSDEFSYYKHTCKDILSHITALEKLQNEVQNTLLKLQSSLFINSKKFDTHFTHDALIMPLESSLMADLQKKLQFNWELDP